LEVFRVRGDYWKSIRERHRCNLTVDEWWRLSELLESNALVRVPRCGACVIRKRWDRRENHFLEKLSQFTLTLPAGQSTDTEPQFMPGHAGHRATPSIFTQMSQNARIRGPPNRERNCTRVEQKLRHNSTVRPGARSRDFSSSSASSPKDLGSLPFMNAS